MDSAFVNLSPIATNISEIIILKSGFEIILKSSLFPARFEYYDQSSRSDYSISWIIVIILQFFPRCHLDSISKRQMRTPFRQSVVCYAITIALVVVMMPNTLISQETYRSFFEEMTMLEPNDTDLFRQSSFSQPTISTASISQAASTGSQQNAEVSNTNNDEPRRAKTKPSKNHGKSITTQQFAFQNSTYGTSGYAEYVVAGRLNIADFNSADTDNRFIFRQNYYHNALDSSLTDWAGTYYNRSGSVSQYVVGFEKILDRSELMSLEMRLPLYGSSDEVFDDGFSTQNFSTGNVQAIFKRIMYQDETRVLSMGVGVSAPTGDDTSFIAGLEEFTIRNRATHIAPFLAGLWTPYERWFFHGFLTFDVPASSNPVEYRDLMPCGCPGGYLGELTSQTLMYLDMSVGYWWYLDPNAATVTGVSSMFELHYTTSLNDADVVTGYTPTNDVLFTNPLQQFDTLEATFGIDVLVRDRINIRTATALPMRDSFNRFFDAEFQTSVSFLF